MAWSAEISALISVRMHDNAIQVVRLPEDTGHMFSLYGLLESRHSRKDFPQGHRFAQWLDLSPRRAKVPLQR